MQKTRILVFGDSIAWGAWDKKGGWAERLKRFCYKKYLEDSQYFFSVYNLGISGNTTEHILERFEFETKQRRYEKPEEVVIIFDFSRNDSAFIHSKNDLRVPEERFKKNTKKLISLAKKYSLKIFLIGGCPVDEKITDPVSWNKDVSYRNTDAKLYDEIMALICREEKITFINVFDQFDINGDFNDGLHPNSEGHRKIYEKVKEKLIENEII